MGVCLLSVVVDGGVSPVQKSGAVFQLPHKWYTACMEYMNQENLVPVGDRIAEKTRYMETGCHVWLGHKLPAGYGTIKHDGKKQYVHRVVWELANGFLGDLTIDHLCKNTSCVNLEHMEAVSQKVNTLRGDSPVSRNARKTHCKRGHEFTRENTLTVKTPYGTGRQCRICSRMRSRRKYEKRRLGK